MKNLWKDKKFLSLIIAITIVIGLEILSLIGIKRIDEKSTAIPVADIKKHFVASNHADFLPKENPEIPTLCHLYAAANWMERETFEFYGINFLGHPDLRIILNVEDMDYHPLLKQYPLVDATRTDKDDKYFGR